MQISKRKKILLVILLFVLTTTGLAIYKLSSAASSTHTVSAGSCVGGIGGDDMPMVKCGMG